MTSKDCMHSHIYTVKNLCNLNTETLCNIVLNGEPLKQDGLVYLRSMSTRYGKADNIDRWGDKRM